MSEFQVTFSAEQLVLVQCAVSLHYDDVEKYRKKAWKYEKPEVVKTVRKDCKADMELCNQIWSLLEAIKVEQGSAL